MTPLNQPFKFDGYFEQVVPRILPLRPLWPGFAVNTLFYAGVLWMMFALPFALRRRLRRRRGQCPACAYPVGQSPVCTECGAAFTPKGTAVIPAQAGIQSRAGSERITTHVHPLDSRLRGNDRLRE